MDHYSNTVEISDEEKREILNHINNLMRRRVHIADSEPLAFKAGKRGYWLPVLLFSVAVLSAAAVFFLSLRDFRLKLDHYAAATSQYFTTEGKLLAALKKETERKLREKDQAIYQMLNRIGDLEQKRQGMVNLVDARVSEKNRELEIALEASLERERVRLAAEGMAVAELEKRLDDLENQKKQENSDILERFKLDTQQQVGETEEEITKEIRKTRSVLENASEERQVFVAEMAKKEGELRSQILEMEQRAEQRVAAAEAKLAELEKLREEEDLLSDQISSLFVSAVDRAEAYDFDGAQKNLEDLRKILTDEGIDEFPSVSRRKDMDLSVIAVVQNIVSRSNAGTRSSMPVDSSQPKISELEARIQRMTGNVNTAKAENRRLVEKVEEVRSAAAAGKAEAYREGQDTALRAVVQFLKAYSQSAGVVSVEDLTRRFLSDIDESLSASLAREMQSLTVGILDEYRARSVPFKLLGTISVVSRDRIVVEPLVRLELSKESLVEIRRTDSEGATKAIARGRVEEELGDRIVIRLTGILSSDAAPAVMDKVYVSSPES